MMNEHEIIEILMREMYKYKEAGDELRAETIRLLVDEVVQEIEKRYTKYLKEVGQL